MDAFHPCTLLLKNLHLWVHLLILLSLQDCHLRYCGAISLLLLKHSEDRSSLNHANSSHIKSEEKCSLEVYFVPQLWIGPANVCGITITELSLFFVSCPPSLWWDKRKPRRLSQPQLTFQVRGWCWLQHANWRHIGETARSVPNGLSLMCHILVQEGPPVAG